MWTTSGPRMMGCKTPVQELLNMEGGEVSEKKFTHVEKDLRKLWYTEYRG